MPAQTVVARTRRTITWARRSACVMGGCCLVAALAQWLNLLPDTRGTWAMYYTLLLATALSVNVAVVGTLHHAVAQAFSAGYRSGVASTTPAPAWPADPKSPGLRLVPGASDVTASL